MEKPTCKTCVYWNGDPNEVRGRGTCQRNAPPSQGDFPSMLDFEWCGEHHKFPAYIAHVEANESK